MLTRIKRIEAIVIPPDDGSGGDGGGKGKLAFMLALLNFRGDETFEYLGPDISEGGPWSVSGTCFGGDGPDRLVEMGYKVVILFDPAKSSHQERIRYAATEQEIVEHQARTFPEVTAENIYVWGEGVGHGFFAQRVKEWKAAQAERG